MSDRPLSGYELQSAFRLLMESIEKIPAILDAELQSVANDGMCDATARVARVIETVKQFEVTLKNKCDEVGQLYDTMWNSIRAKNEELRKRIESVPPVPEIKVPYNIKELISIAEKCQGLSDTAWQRVVELAKALVVT